MNNPSLPKKDRPLFPTAGLPGLALDHSLLLPRLLELAALLTSFLVVILRTFSGGQDFDSLDTAVIDALIWFALSLWLLRKFLLPSFTLPAPGIFLAILLFLLFSGLAVLRAGEGGDAMTAGILARHWVMEALLFWLLIDLLSTRERALTVLTALGACTTIVILFALYQRGYALNYFVGVIEAAPELVAQSAGDNPLFQQLYISRVKTMRVYGPHGAYPNTLAGFLVLLLPFLFWVALSSLRTASSSLRKLFLLTLAAGAIFTLIYTGSRAGLLAARAVELACLLIFLRRTREGRGRKIDLLAWSLLLAPVTLGLPVLLRHLLQGAGVAEAEGVSSTLHALLWFGEILFLARLSLSGRPLPAVRWIRSLALLLLGSGLLLALVLSLAPERAPEPLSAWAEQTRSEFNHGTSTPAVRWNYWVAGLRMISDHPWRGLGLEQFGVYYPSYKTLSGTAVKRAHNQYIQLAADGGIPLLLSWLAIWVLFFGQWGKAETLPAETWTEQERNPRQLYLAAVIAMGVVALLMTYIKMNGFHIEFLFNELGRGPSSRWPVDKGPALIHFLLHLVILPLGGVMATLFLGRELFARTDLSGLITACRLGIAGLLLHLFFDFHYYTQVISTTLFVLTATVIALRGVRQIEIRLPARLHSLSLIVFTGGLAFFGWMYPLRQWVRAEALASIPQVGLEGGASTQMQAQIKVYESLLKATPEDASLHRRISECYMMLCRLEAQSMVMRGLSPKEEGSAVRNKLHRASPAWREAAVNHSRIVSQLVPADASAHAALARTLLALFPQEITARAEAEEHFARASHLNPHMVNYRNWLGRLAMERGDQKMALEVWQEALRLDSNPFLTDPLSRLTKEERTELEQRIRELERP